MGHGASMRLPSHNPIFPIITSHDVVFVQHFMIILPDPSTDEPSLYTKFIRQNNFKIQSASEVSRISNIFSHPPHLLPKLYLQLWQKGINCLQSLAM